MLTRGRRGVGLVVLLGGAKGRLSYGAVYAGSMDCFLATRLSFGYSCLGSGGILRPLREVWSSEEWVQTCWRRGIDGVLALLAPDWLLMSQR